MFDQTFVDTTTQRSRQPYAVLVSSLFQAAILVGLILGSMLYTGRLPTAQLRSMLVAPPPPSNIPKPPETMARHVSTAARAFHAQSLVAPAVVPKQIARIDDAPAAPVVPGTTASGAADLTGNALLLGSTESAMPAPPPPKAPQKAAAPRGPMRVGGTVAAANLIRRVEPAYPALAKAARIQGSVEFTALINKEGRIENLQLVSGHPLLVNAAREAILQWRYRPTLLNGEPVEVMTSIVVRFTLAQ